MSELSFSRRVAVTAAAFTAAGALVVGCSDAKKESAPAPKTAAKIAKPNKPVNKEVLVSNYLNSPRRDNRITAAVNLFGHKLLEQEAKTGSTSGPYDAFCSPTDTFSTGAQGYTSEGFNPTSTDDCDVQHNPQYGGQDMQVDASVGVEHNGQFNPNKILGVYAAGKAISCTVSIQYLGKNVGGWDVEIFKNGININPRTDTDSAEYAGKLVDAKLIDNEGLACIEKADQLYLQ